MASSDDDIDVDAMIASHQQPENSNDSAMPDWIASHQTPLSAPIAVSSGEESEEPAGPSQAGPSGAAAAAMAAAADDDADKPDSSQQAAVAAAGKRASSSSAAMGGPHKSEIPVILPEKLLRHKVLIELEPAPHQATELSGDAGAVGRLVATSLAAEDGCFKIDLKGMLYQATVLPLAGTALVVNMGPTEAKVESVLNDFVRLREESSYHDTGMTVEGAAGMAELLADDEENYQLGAAGNEGQDGEKPATKKKRPSAAAAAAGAKRSSSSKALKPTKAGVKKKTSAKPGSKLKSAGAKGSKTPGTAGKGKGSAAKGTKAAKPPAAKAAKAAAKPKAASASAAKKKPKKKKGSDDESSAGDWDSDWSGE